MVNKPVPRSLVAITFGNMCLLGFLSSMRGVSFPLIKNGFAASYNDMGIMTALASFSSVCLSVAAGIYMSRLGLKRTMLTAFAIVIAGVLSLYFASSFWITVAFYLILQSGFSFFEISLNGTGVRIFTKRSGLMLSLLHFCFGAGAILGPRYMGILVSRVGLRWQEAYPAALVPVLAMLVITLVIRFPPKTESARAEPFWTMLKKTEVWLFGFILGISSAIEGCSVSWSGLYLQDVYGLDPETSGAVFVSTFFALYTLSRFLSGFVIEKTGYLRSVLVAAVIIVVIYAVAFSLGRPGIFLLPITGFFIALIWPAMLAISVGVFREKAQTASSAILSIAFTLNGIIQFGFGFINDSSAGAAWGYRSCVLYGAILVALLLAVRTMGKSKAWGVR